MKQLLHLALHFHIIHAFLCNPSDQFQMKIRKNSRRRLRSLKYTEVVVVLQRTAKKCTKSYNTRAQPLIYSLTLLCGGVLVADADVVSLSSLISETMKGITKAPSKRIRIFLNPQLFLSGYGFHPHTSGEFDSEWGYF